MYYMRLIYITIKVACM